MGAPETFLGPSQGKGGSTSNHISTQNVDNLDLIEHNATGFFSCAIETNGPPHQQPEIQTRV